ncbi:glutamine synthetase family protein [Methyloligella sp. 2.7D]|uniref:glutamine synthetase family protein n=1 Tax=unclassified Methyloligella TaxID=2625955 RepID=UPI00157CAC5E|nr:glutamine synthetase family protein [Methyloligella sp. GL2]QKP77938.1 glutamine synthetase [Methyloligella sp. GL2]
MSVESGDKSAMDEAAVRAFLDENAIETVVCAIPDLWGRLVGKRLTRRSFERVLLEGESLNASVYLFCVDMDMEPQPGYAITDWSRGFQDCRFVPDAATLRLVPWMPGTAFALCDVVDEQTGALLELAPRTILKRQIERAAKAGLSFKCATELEFYMFEDSFAEAWEKKYEALTPTSRYRADYHVLQSTLDESFIGRARQQLLQAGVEVEFSKTEWGLGQQEINLRYAETLEMADQHILYKTWMKELAGLDGKSLTFMPKPFFEDVGSSCHVHMSLWDAADGTPKGWQDGQPANLSPVFDQFLAGLLAGSPDLMVLFAPTVNAYKRLQPESFAPTAIALGLDNRTCAYRLVGHGAGYRVENRVPGADTNPYLALAGMIAAGLEGIENGRKAPSLYDGNAYLDEALTRVPGTLGEAIACFRNSALAKSALGEEVHTHLLNFYARENAAYENGCVTDWERKRYFERI